MKIKLFIVTYRNSKDLTTNLNSLFASNWAGHDLEVCVINNHSDLQLDNALLSRIKLMNNVCRPDFSTGHLSRNWNQAIIHGFKSLSNPDCDIVIHCQDDTVFFTDWCYRLIELHQKYSFVQVGVGDNFCSYLPEAVKNIGLWDERFCGIGFQEADYFLRAKIHNSDYSSINDYWHDRVHNTHEIYICDRTEPVIIDDHLNHSIYHKESTKYHIINKNLFYNKWGKRDPEHWSQQDMNTVPSQSLIENYIYYPYFELDVHNLKEKNYFVEGQGVKFLKDE